MCLCKKKENIHFVKKKGKKGEGKKIEKFIQDLN